jgi:hypothetical protein
VKIRQADETPVTVSEEARRTGDIRGRWSWVEPSVWTDRMLTALEQGVKGGKWYSLMDIPIISACPMPSLPNMGCSRYPQPMLRPVNPLGGEPPTGEPYAGDPHVRFGGGSGRVAGCSYPYTFDQYVTIIGL